MLPSLRNTLRNTGIGVRRWTEWTAPSGLIDRPLPDPAQPSVCDAFRPRRRCPRYTMIHVRDQDFSAFTRDASVR